MGDNDEREVEFEEQSSFSFSWNVINYVVKEKEFSYTLYGMGAVEDMHSINLKYSVAL